MYNEFPKELHDNLGIPGAYNKKISNLNVYSEKGIIGEMDVSYIVNPDYETIFEPMIVNGEHQSTRVTEEKLNRMCQYSFQQIADVNLPQFTYVASHIKKEEHVQKYYCTPSYVLEPYFINLGEKDNAKRLSKVKKIINNNKSLSDLDALNLGIIVEFAQRDRGLEITEEVIELYIKISKQISQRMELTLYSVISLMVDAYSTYEKDYQRLINMIKNNTSKESQEEFVTLTLANNKIKKLEKKTDTLEKENNNLKKNLNKALDKINQLENELKKKNNTPTSK